MISGSGIRNRTYESWLWMLSTWCGETFAICVVDLSRGTLKSYLIEFPRAHCKLDQVTQDHHIPWVRREKWARLLVKAISDIHSKGFVVGSFFGSWSPILTKGSFGLCPILEIQKTFRTYSQKSFPSFYICVEPRQMCAKQRARPRRPKQISFILGYCFSFSPRMYFYRV